MTLHDCLIIGGGPAGLSAAMTARRAGLGVLLLEKDIIGGGPAVLASIDNYPGIAAIDGWTFTRTMEKQVRDLGVEILEPSEAVSVLLMDDTTKRVITGSGDRYGARAVIIASGGAPKKLHVDGEERLLRRGVHYCAQCAGPAYKERMVMVCGNGGPALAATDHLLKLGVKKVIFVSEDPELKGDALLVARLLACDRFQFLPRTRGGSPAQHRLPGLNFFSWPAIKAGKWLLTRSLCTGGLCPAQHFWPPTGIPGVISRWIYRCRPRWPGSLAPAAWSGPTSR